MVYRAGQSIDDSCRACKTSRRHTVIAVDAEGRVARVMCDSCGSQHNYRDGGGDERAAAFSTVSERERTRASMSDEGGEDLGRLLRRILREELGLTAVVPAEKWRGGELVLRPGKPGLQEKKWPIEAFFHKIVMLRNRLRTLEQQVNASELPEDAKVRLQSYVTACYGTLTSFNVLFAAEDDKFEGAGEKD
jgi:transcription elongation factor Elf1